MKKPSKKNHVIGLFSVAALPLVLTILDILLSALIILPAAWLGGYVALNAPDWSSVYIGILLIVSVTLGMLAWYGHKNAQNKYVRLISFLVGMGVLTAWFIGGLTLLDPTWLE